MGNCLTAELAPSATSEERRREETEAKLERLRKASGRLQLVQLLLSASSERLLSATLC